MNKNVFWFVGNPKAADNEKKQMIIDMILDDLKRLGINLWGVQNILALTDLSHSEKEGFYLLCADKGTCSFVDTSNMSELVVSHIKDSSLEIITDIDGMDELNQKVEEVKNEIKEIERKKRELDSQIYDLNTQIAKKKQELTILNMKIRKLDNPEPKVQVDDYILYKGYGSTPVVCKITEVRIDTNRYCWTYRGKYITSGEHDYIIPDRIISVIAAKPSYKEKDIIKISDVDWTIRLVRYDKEKECWKYKIDMTKNGMKSSTWVYESEIK